MTNLDDMTQTAVCAICNTNAGSVWTDDELCICRECMTRENYKPCDNCGAYVEMVGNSTPVTCRACAKKGA